MNCRVIGHRGASFDHPENTLEAFRGARAQGADWVELDVRRTADGELVVHHDPHLPDGRVDRRARAGELPPEVATWPRRSPAPGPWASTSRSRTSTVRPGSIPPGRWRRRPSLVIRAERGRDPHLVVRPGDDRRVPLRRPAIPTGYLVYVATEPDRRGRVAVARGHAALHPWDPMVDAAVVERCHDAGLLVNVWTVDDPERIAQLAAWGVDGIVTNRPDLALGALGR